MKKILVALLAASAILTTTLAGCGQKKCSVAAYDEDEEIVLTSEEIAGANIFADEYELLEEDDGDFVVLDGASAPMVRETTTHRVTPGASATDNRTLDQIIEEELGHVPSYIQAPRSNEEVRREAEPVLGAADLADDDDDEWEGEIEDGDDVAASPEQPAPVTAEPERATPQPSEVAVADYEKYMDIDSYEAEVEEDLRPSTASTIPAATTIPAAFDFLPPALPAMIGGDDEGFSAPPAGETVAASFRTEFPQDSDLYFPPAPVSAVFQEEDDSGHSLSLDGFDDDSLEFFGRIADSLLEESEG